MHIHIIYVYIHIYTYIYMYTYTNIRSPNPINDLCAPPGSQISKNYFVYR